MTFREIYNYNDIFVVYSTDGGRLMEAPNIESMVYQSRSLTS